MNGVKWSRERPRVLWREQRLWRQAKDWSFWRINRLGSCGTSYRNTKKFYTRLYCKIIVETRKHNTLQTGCIRRRECACIYIHTYITWKPESLCQTYHQSLWLWAQRQVPACFAWWVKLQEQHDLVKCSCRICELLKICFSGGVEFSSREKSGHSSENIVLEVYEKLGFCSWETHCEKH